MKFEVNGPFVLSRTNAKILDSSSATQKELWASIEERYPGLSDACGCYVFAIKASRGTLPWYVGKSEKQPFRKECLSPHKVVHFNNAVAGRKGTPVLYLVPQLTGSGKYRKPTINIRPAIQELESLLIGMAVSRNSELMNIRGTKWLQRMEVEGFLNSKKTKSGPARELRNVFGL